MPLRVSAVMALILGFLCCFPVFAKDNVKLPVGCKKVGYKFDLFNVIFKPSFEKRSQAIYFIHNISGRQIYLHEAGADDGPYIMHLNGTIDTAHWSVFALSKKTMKFNCAYFDRSKKMHEVTSCKNALAICQFPRAKFGPNQHGTYWVLYNATRKEAMGITKEHGVWLNPRRSGDE